MKLSVVIPARNEDALIRDTLVELARHLDGGAIHEHELLVVDDGSSDGTAEVVRRVAATDPRVRLIANPAPHGFGHAVRRGLEATTGDAVVITMADASDSPADVLTYYRVLRDEAECVFGSRFMRGSSLTDYPLPKLVVNRLANTLIRLMFGLRCNDITNAFKGFRRYVVEGCQPLVSPHFNLTIELPLKAVVRGYTYRTVPVSWRNRAAGVSSFLLKEQGSRYLFILLSVWFEWLLVRRDYRRTGPERPETWWMEGTG